jgi:hypothetical protein
MRISRWQDPGRLIAERARQFGQSSMEYTVVVFFAVLVLVVPDANGDVPLVQLANAMKRFYTGFAYAVSLSTTIMPL